MRRQRFQGLGWKCPAVVKGTVFSRDPRTGLKRVTGDVFVEGLNAGGQALPFSALQQLHPDVASQISEALQKEEAQARRAVQADFCFDDKGLVWSILRPLDCCPAACLRIVQDMLSEKLLEPEQALLALESEYFTVRQEPEVREYAKAVRGGGVLAKGVCSFPGAAVGRLAWDADSAWALSEKGEGVVLLVDRLELCHRDALLVCSAVLIRESCQRAPVSVPCLSGLGQVDLTAGGIYTVWATQGEVLQGALSLTGAPTNAAASPLVEVACRHCPIELRANFDTLESLQAVQGPRVDRVGLARVESFFRTEGEIAVLRQAVVGAQEAVSDCLEAFEAEFEKVLEPLLLYLSQGRQPALTVRLFDSPLCWLTRLWARESAGKPTSFPPLLENSLHELSATQALRGGRLSRIFPCFFDSQVRVLARVAQRFPVVRLDVMLPGIAALEEVEFFVPRAREVWRAVNLAPLRIGMMLEIPRACLLADHFLPYCDFFSFGTGDLTESTWSLSRYDAPLEYLSRLPEATDPFDFLDLDGVGELMRVACQKLRRCAPEVEIGWCGAQAARHTELSFVHELGLSYVSVPAPALAKLRVSLAQQSLQARE